MSEHPEKMQTQQEQCYPCLVYGRTCVLDEQWHRKTYRLRPAQVLVLPYSNVESACPWFDVALWLRAERMTIAAFVGYVEAASTRRLKSARSLNR